MKKYFEKASIALIIAMMFILAIFGGAAMKTHTNADNVKYKTAVDYTVAEPEEDPNQEWDISLDQQLRLTLGPWYSSDGKYANPTIPVYTIQKTRSDTENMVILFCGEGYTKSQQQKFINDVKKVWEGAMQYEPYRSYADRFNVYALCTASESSFNNGDSTFFDVVIDKSSGPMIGLSKSISKNHIFERCIGPAFLEEIHDAHIPKRTDPNSSYWVGNNSPLSEYEPFYYVHKYINQFAVLVNTTQDFGGSHRNYERGIHYLVTPADSARAQKTFTHELGHGLLELGDEYMSSTTQQTDLTSLNVAHTHDPNNVKWKQLLGFRKTYTCNALGYGNAYNSSYECLMRDTTYQFCEVCKLQGSKRMSQLIDGKSLYVADPEVKKYTGQYSQPSDFADTTYNGYYYFENYRKGVLLSGTDKNKFNTSMAGEKIQLRTIVQNLSDKTQRYVTMKLWIKHAGGSVATTTGGQRLEATQTFTIPVWSEKSKFWTKGALSYEGSNMNSGLENCELIYQIPLDADLKHGDYVAFEVTDESGNILANDNTETQTYANINIEYKFEDGTPMPNANKATIPVAVGSQLNWTAAPSLYGHTLSRVEGLNQIVSGSGQTVTYYYNYVKASYNIMVTDCVAKKGEDTVGYAQYGDIIKVTANTAPTGKVFDTWVITGLDTTGMDLTKTEITFNMPANAVEIKATYREVEYTVSVTGGTGGGVYVAGTSVTLTANTPGVGERFTGWTIDGISGIDTTQTSLTFNMPNGNVTATANYKDIEYSVTVTGGTVDKSTAKYGDTVTITATVPTGKRFVEWTSESGSIFTDKTSVTTTFTMPAGDVTVVATFEDEMYRVDVTNGTTTHNIATYQTEVTVKANEPDTDMYFDKWEVTGLDTTGMDLTKTEIKFQMPAGNVTFKATYLSVAKYEIVIVDGTKDKSPAKAGETITITANPAKPGKVFDKWTCETAGVTIEFKSATSSKTTFVMPACEITIQAHFRDIEAAPSIEIKVEGGTGAGTYTQGESATVTAEDKEGKEFVGWQDESGKIVSTKKEYTFKVEGEKTLTAVYDDKSSGGGEITPPAKKDGLSGGQIAGIVIGSVAVAGIGGFAVLWFAVKKKTFADLGVALKKGFTAIGNFFKTLGAKIKALFTKKK